MATPWRPPQAHLPRYLLWRQCCKQGCREKIHMGQRRDLGMVLCRKHEPELTQAVEEMYCQWNKGEEEPRGQSPSPEESEVSEGETISPPQKASTETVRASVFWGCRLQTSAGSQAQEQNRPRETYQTWHVGGSLFFIVNIPLYRFIDLFDILRTHTPRIVRSQTSTECLPPVSLFVIVNIFLYRSIDQFDIMHGAHQLQWKARLPLSRNVFSLSYPRLTSVASQVKITGDAQSSEAQTSTRIFRSPHGQNPTPTDLSLSVGRQKNAPGHPFIHPSQRLQFPTVRTTKSLHE
ncbi:hypothetical protein BCR34DRAFT_589228 [Clohesyomyces aquaticus]|uniref:Uncharacterized protein n=1 Tax=Clohesyomyces aquaticus TaxID=1231657 RepID=A0A1Y1ZGV6_9PLEO|nr:hypothetical protein BCR34DRAFT_589228 [Clohesyomyces aquaticus]